MSDCISRQAAIDAICKACSMEGDYHKCDGYPETSTWCDELVALRALPSAQPETNCSEIPNNWIPCSERLPENDGMYYVTITRMGGIDAVPCIWYNKKWAIGEAKVIAWIAIPGPYRAERREE